jgi:hypothetical protein
MKMIGKCFTEGLPGNVTSVQASKVPETSLRILQSKEVFYFFKTTNCLRLTTHLVLHKAGIVGVMD